MSPSAWPSLSVFRRSSTLTLSSLALSSHFLSSSSFNEFCSLNRRLRTSRLELALAVTRDIDRPVFLRRDLEPTPALVFEAVRACGPTRSVQALRPPVRTTGLCRSLL